MTKLTAVVVTPKGENGIDVLIDLASDAESFAPLASLVRPGGAPRSELATSRTPEFSRRRAFHRTRSRLQRGLGLIATTTLRRSSFFDHSLHRRDEKEEFTMRNNLERLGEHLVAAFFGRVTR
jgi:hypothetical protein